ncbi:alpha-2,3 sialyltransferase [Helicobacter sp. faydin-H20]|uniref:alpha-2,3-sialyltransferase n=1 Tax=Helicobacter anatolicus TaxID=2905874 RepID=UPI001E2A5AF2|nr:alpha-2,3-sialyltransferase [Helicobacter anatolicus]MCE3036869.1 alpha-2,3 sialyltransferase [Helicobacter anatolicus]
MKPIIIAGNGPSLKYIDYTRIPENYDLFRCNQFYLEDSYFLGKDITGVFFNPLVFKTQYFTLNHLINNHEYQVKDVYCNFAGFDNQHQTKEVEFFFPLVKMTTNYLIKVPQLHALLKFNQYYYQKNFTSGIIMIIVAIAQGYKEIYLTGIDFYEGGGTNYAFEVKDLKNLTTMIPHFQNQDFKDTCHSKEVDLQAIAKIQELFPDIKLYSITPDSTLSKYIPLAPQQNQNSTLPVKKPQNYTKDVILPPNFTKGGGACKNQKFPHKHINKISSYARKLLYKISHRYKKIFLRNNSDNN